MHKISKNSIDKTIIKIADKLAKAFNNNSSISPIPIKYTKNIIKANLLRKLSEKKVHDSINGFKAGGTGLSLLKKLGEKEPFYAAVFKKNILKNNKKVKINNFTFGVELEVCYLINKNFFKFKKKISLKNVHRFITHIAPCIEIVGYRQKKRGIKFLGDLCSDFGANYKFIVGSKKKYKKNNVKNLKTHIINHNRDQSVIGNTNTVYINPLNSLKFVLNKLKSDKIQLSNNFYVFTGSTVGIVPIKRKSTYIGKIDRIGKVVTTIN